MVDSVGEAVAAAVSDQQATTEIANETAAADAADKRDDPRDPITGSVDIRTFSATLEAGRAATTAAIGKGFAFTPEQIQTQLDRCQSLSGDWHQALHQAQSAEQSIYAPAPDPAGSVTQTNQAQQSLVNLVGVIASQIDFLTNWQDVLKQAKANYIRTERLTEGQWRRLAAG